VFKSVKDIVFITTACCLAFSGQQLLGSEQQQIQPVADIQVAKPLPVGKEVFVPYGGREEPLSPQGTPEYNYSDLPGNVLPQPGELLKAVQGDPTNIKKWGDLTSGFNTELQILTVQEAAQCNIPVLLTRVDGKYTRKILVKNHIAFKEYPGANGSRIHIGGGLRWIMDVATIDANAHMSFPALAAQAQLGFAYAKVKIEAIGIINDDIRRAVSNIPDDLNVENYVQMSQSFDKGISLINSELAIDPRVVEVLTVVTPTADADYKKALTMSWAVARISEGKSLGEAQNGCPYSDTMAKSIVEDIYRQRCNIMSLMDRPNSVQIEQAKLVLGRMRITSGK